MSFSPLVREAAINKFRDEMRRTLNDVLANEIVASTCLSCIHFREQQGEVCGLYKMRPPARVIAFGCPEYTDNLEVPF